MPWHNAWGLPRNAKTGLRYQGANVFALFGEEHWATMKQWNGLGARVKKGERASHVWRWVTVELANAEADENGEKPTRMVPKVFPVWHCGQVDGWEAPTAAVSGLTEGERIAHADKFFGSVGAKVSHDGGSRAFYRPSSDSIHLPKFEAFTSSLDYYSTLGHELGHWTGAESRLDRKMTGKFGSADYAFEELVAELSAAFTMADLGLVATAREDHAQYVKGWMQVLTSDAKAFSKAASLAEKASKFLKASAAAVTSEEVAA
jgi:antirestriction protein ArdC